MLTAEQAQRYSRHFVLREIGAAGQKRLLQSKVLVIGAGGLGSSALLYLAAAGVGTLGIADYDRVELSNLQRQILHSTGALGMRKAESARTSIQALNPDVNVQVYDERMTVDNLQRVIEPYDLVLDCTDRFETKFLINDACVLSQKPYVHAGCVRWEGQVMTYSPGRGPCLRCLLGGVPEGTVTCSEAGVVGAVTGVLGSVQALEAIKFLLGTGELLVGKILYFDAFQMQIRVVNMPSPDPDCAVCGKNPAIRSLAGNRADYAPRGCGE